MVLEKKSRGVVVMLHSTPKTSVSLLHLSD